MALISVRELAARVGDPALRLVDLRWYLGRPGAGRRTYEGGHIGAAIHLDLDTDLRAREGAGRHPLPDPATFRSRMAAVGIGSHSFVAAYDDAGGTIAARLWWMLDNLGHRGGVAVLDGGIGAWVAAGRELTTGPTIWPPATDLDLAGHWTRVIERVELANRLGEVTLLDARAPERYRGEVEPIDPAAGHIPTAVNVPTSGNLDATDRFLAPVELRHRYGALVPAGRPVVTSCGSGVTACHNALAMRICGLPNPILYAGSFSDWSTAGLPVIAGAEPGVPPVGDG